MTHSPLHAQLAARNAELSRITKREHEVELAVARERYWALVVRQLDEPAELTPEQLDALDADMLTLDRTVDDLASDGADLAELRRIRAEFDLGGRQAELVAAEQGQDKAHERAARMRDRANGCEDVEVQADLREGAADLVREANDLLDDATAAVEEASQALQRADGLVAKLIDRGLHGADAVLTFTPTLDAHDRPAPVKVRAVERVFVGNAMREPGETFAFAHVGELPRGLVLATEPHPEPEPEDYGAGMRAALSRCNPTSTQENQ